MIATGILQLIWGIVSPILNRIPVMQINYDGIANSSVYQFLRAGLYFLPMPTVVAILQIVIALWVLRIVIAVLRTFWDVLPVV